MNPNGVTTESEFVLRRVGESFPQFLRTLGTAVPTWLAVCAALAVLGRIVYHFTASTPYRARHAGRAVGWLRWLTVCLLCAASSVVQQYPELLYRFPHSGLFDAPFAHQLWALLAAVAVPALLTVLPATVYVPGWSRVSLLHRTGTEAMLRALGGASLYLLGVAFLDNLFRGDVMGGSAASAEVSSGFGHVNALLWFVLTGAVLAAGSAFAVAMYVKDARAVPWYCAAFLALLRVAVYVLLCGAFLLPATQDWERTEKRSRVLVLLDVSPSMTQVGDDVAAGGGKKPQTRIQKALDFLTDEKVAFVRRLTRQNPVHVYRFGTRLDEESQSLALDEANWARAEWDAFAAYDFKPWALRGLSEPGRAAVREGAAFGGDRPGTADWAAEWLKKPDDEAVPAALAEEDRARLKENRGKLDKRIDVARSIVNGTNVPDSIAAAINRESANMVRGLIVLTDGRSNLGSDSSYAELKERATRENVPVFTVAVGEDRQTVSIAVTDVVAPDRAPPDEAFKIAVEADGVGLANREVEVRLGLYMPTRDPKKDAPDHELVAPLTFQPGDPPHGAAEFLVDPAKLPEKLTELGRDGAGTKRKLKEGAWSVVARIAKDKREAFDGKDHARERSGIQVLKRPLRVLIVASGPTREYQTLKTLLVRETIENRAELSILVQNEGGSKGEIVQDIPPERLLTRFPSVLDTAGTAKLENKYDNLNEYDLIVGFDPDWSELSEQQIKNVQTWVDNLGGGLVLVAGAHNTFQLARAEANSRLSPLLNILPVIPDDIVVQQTRPIPRTPRRLYLRPAPDFDVLKLDEEAGPEDPVAGWERFFTNRDKYASDPDLRRELNPPRGFFSCYPVRSVKPGAQVLAEFADADEKGDKAVRPWLVTAQPARGRTAYLGSGESYRLRAIDPVVGPEYHQRFWIKLARYVSANRDVRAARGRVLLNKEYVSGSPVRVQARLLAPNGVPYPIGSYDAKFTVVPLTAAGERVVAEDPKTKQKSQKEYGPYQMAAKKGAGEFDGYYQGQVVADPLLFPPGENRYKVVVKVPDSPGETLEGEFAVRKSDPELDQARPDFAALLQMAGEFDAQLQARLTDQLAREQLLERLPKEAGKAKLAFRLGDREMLSLIPACMKPDFKDSRYRGQKTDVWDMGFALPPSMTAWFADGPVTIAYVLVAAVGLLSLEWLTRKLLRLA